jgi:hypothetical protein
VPITEISNDPAQPSRLLKKKNTARLYPDGRSPNGGMTRRAAAPAARRRRVAGSSATTSR